MFLESVLLFALIFQSGTSLELTCQEGPHTVDLKYYCLKILRFDNIVEKSPVILVHGVASSLRGWNGTYQALANQTGRRICLVDLRNHGDSPWDNITDTTSMAEDIARFINRKKFSKVNIIGGSLGGKVAVQYILKHPCRVNSGVIGDMRPNGISAEAYALVYLLFGIFKEGVDSIPAGLNKTQAQMHMIDFLNEKLRQLGVNATIGADAAAALDFCFIDGRWQFRFNLDVLFKALQDIANFLVHSSGLYKGPTLFIYGTASPFKVWEVEKEIYYLFPNAKLIPVEGASHDMVALYPVFINETVKLLSTVD